MNDNSSEPPVPITYTAPTTALQTPSQLSLSQSAFLAAYVVEGTVRAAARSAGIMPETHLRWVRESESYRTKFQAIASVSLDEARARLDALLPQAAQVYEEGLEADKEIGVICPACEHEFSIRVENFARRLSIAKDLFKRSGDLAAKLQVSGEVKHRDMALEDRLALAQIQSWDSGGRQGNCPVPPDVYDDLNRRGLLTGPGPMQSTDSQVNTAVRRYARSIEAGRDPEVLEGEYEERS